MARFYSFSIVNGTEFQSLENLFVDNAGAVVLYNDGRNLVFTLPNYTNKVIKIYRADSSSANLSISFADSWTSGATITGNVKTIIPVATLNYIYIFYMVVANNFVLFGNTGNGDSTRNFTIIGNTTSGRNVIIGYGEGSTFTRAGFDTATYGNVFFKGINGSIQNLADSKLLRQPISIVMNGNIIPTVDGVIETIEGLYSVSMQAPSSTYICNQTGFFSPANVYSSNVILESSLFVPL